MVASVPQIQSVLNVFVIAILIYYCPSQIFALCHAQEVEGAAEKRAITKTTIINSNTVFISNISIVSSHLLLCAFVCRPTSLLAKGKNLVLLVGFYWNDILSTPEVIYSHMRGDNNYAEKNCEGSCYALVK